MKFDTKNPTKNLHDLIIKKQINKGCFGVVYKAQTKTGEIVALKAIKTKNHHATENGKKEIFVYTQLPPHPNILKCYGHAQSVGTIYILFEYMKHKDLWEIYFKNNKKTTLNQISKYIWQLADALRLAHYYEIIHADVKLENILIDSRDNIKLCDFGLSSIKNKKYKSDYRRGVCGTTGYIAPEVYDNNKNITPAVDAWAVGIVLYELLYRTNPFIKSYETEDKKKETPDRHKLKKIMSKFPDLPENIDPDLHDLFERVFKIDPLHRAMLSEIQRHRWICKHYTPY